RDRYHHGVRCGYARRSATGSGDSGIERWPHDRWRAGEARNWTCHASAHRDADLRQVCRLPERRRVGDSGRCAVQATVEASGDVGAGTDRIAVTADACGRPTNRPQARAYKLHIIVLDPSALSFIIACNELPGEVAHDC